MKLRFLVLLAAAVPLLAQTPRVPPSLPPSNPVTPAPSVTPALKPLTPAPAPVTPVAAVPVVPAVPTIMQWRGQNGGMPDLTTQVLRSSAQWSSAWQRVSRGAPRALDESKEMAVEISAGEKPTGGFVVNVIATSTDTTGALVVEYEVQAPSPETFVTQALAYPWAIAIVPKNDRPVVFKKVERVAPKR